MARKNMKDIPPDPRPDKRSWLYSPDCPEGKIVEGADAIAAALKDGWVDSPAKVREMIEAREAKASKAKSNGGKQKATNNDNSP